MRFCGSIAPGPAQLWEVSKGGGTGKGGKGTGEGGGEGESKGKHCTHTHTHTHPHAHTQPQWSFQAFISQESSAAAFLTPVSKSKC